jgi:alkylation response protein AidB-like acyl-CoA dehydrogenase
MSGAAVIAPLTDPTIDTVVEEVAATARAVDAGEHDVRPALTALGTAGLLDLGTVDGHGTLAEQAAVLRRLAGVCMASAFSAWAQHMAIDYIDAWGSPELKADVLPDLTAGTRPGATAMATAFQDALGLREIGITDDDEGDDGIVLDGLVPWASNLFADGAVVVLPARTSSGRRLIVAIRTDQAGVTVNPHPPLLALGSTASTSLQLDGVRVPSTHVLTDRFLDFLADVRGPFLLLQTAFCLGIAEAALASAGGRPLGPDDVLADDHRELSDRLAARTSDHARLLARGRQSDTEVVALRLAAGRLGVEATRHEANAAGGAGYLATSATARRLREAAFLPIQSPTEAQLRWELSRSA